MSDDDIQHIPPYKEQDKQLFLRYKYGSFADHVTSLLPSANGMGSYENGAHILIMNDMLNQMQLPEYKEKSAGDKTEVLRNHLQATLESPAAIEAGLTMSMVLDKYKPAIENYIRNKEMTEQRADALRDSYVENLRSQGFLKGYIPPESNEQKSFIAQHQGYGVGVRMGEFIKADSSQSNIQYLATDNLIDCNCVVLIGRNPLNPQQNVVSLAHVDVVTDVNGGIKQMLAEMPDGYKVEALVLSGKQNDNPYLQMDILHALHTSGRLDSIRYEPDGPSTVAVHVQTGTLLTSDHNEYPRTAYNIKEFDGIKFSFSPPNEKRGQIRDIAWSALSNLGSEPSLIFQGNQPLVQVSAGTRQPVQPYRSANAIIDSLQQDDGVLSGTDLKMIADIVSKELGQKIQVHYDQERQSITIGTGQGSALYTRYKVTLADDLKGNGKF